MTWRASHCLPWPWYTVLPSGPRNLLAAHLMTHEAREFAAEAFDPTTSSSYATVVVRTVFNRYGPPTSKVGWCKLKIVLV